MSTPRKRNLSEMSARLWRLEDMEQHHAESGKRFSCVVRQPHEQAGKTSALVVIATGEDARLLGEAINTLCDEQGVTFEERVQAEWFSTAKELPPANEDVLVGCRRIDGWPLVRIAVNIGSYWLFEDSDSVAEHSRYPHWMPLPAVPEVSS